MIHITSIKIMLFGLMLILVGGVIPGEVFSHIEGGVVIIGLILGVLGLLRSDVNKPNDN